MQTKKTIKDTFGAQYFDKTTRQIITARSTDLYYYTTYIGDHNITVSEGDCAVFLSGDKKSAHVAKGPRNIISSHFATIIRGYMCDNKSSDIGGATHLPYINGCSTKQIFPPIRLGDPTLQMLYMPAFTSEQAHHVHSTVRAVYVLSGRGKSIVGTKNHKHTRPLEEGMTVIFQGMCPHHFETEDSDLTVLPLHIYSSVGLQEHNHPMFNGTYKVTQG
jgi:uncharacterized RmlC-like cupin family protein